MDQKTGETACLKRSGKIPLPAFATPAGINGTLELSDDNTNLWIMRYGTRIQSQESRLNDLDKKMICKDKNIHTMKLSICALIILGIISIILNILVFGFVYFKSGHINNVDQSSKSEPSANDGDEYTYGEQYCKCPTEYMSPTDIPTSVPTDMPTFDPTETDSGSIWSVGDYKISFLDRNHENWLLCNGSYVKQSDYPLLYDVIGQTFSNDLTDVEKQYIFKLQIPKTV